MPLGGSKVALMRSSALQAAPVPGSTLTTLPFTPTSRWHATFSPNITTSSGRITGADDIQGVANLAEISGIGPTDHTDEWGRKCWRFNSGASRMEAAAGLVLSQRACTVFFICRAHRNHSGVLFSLGNTATPANTGSGLLRINADGGNAPPYIAGGTKQAHTDATNGKYCLAGSQLQVIWVSSAAAGQTLGINATNPATVAVQSGNVIGATGAMIGAYSQTPGASGTWTQSDIYEMIVYNSALSAVNAQAVAAALTANWGIAEVTDTLTLEGDSLTAGFGNVLSGDFPGMVISAPGGAFDSGWRVVDTAIAGNTIANMATRRDVANTIYNATLSGRNVITIEAGRNDMIGASSAATAYAALVALIHTTTTGYLERAQANGHEAEICVGVNQADGNSGCQTKILSFRTLLRDTATFFNDLDAGSGDTFEGQVRLCDLASITYTSHGACFDVLADCSDTDIYQADVTHPTTLGYALKVSGGDTSQYGYMQRAYATS